MPYNTIVLIKQILDIDQMKTDSSTGEPITQGIPMKIETLSKNAIEAAVQIKEKFGGKVTGLIYGTEQSNAAMKEAYAMGVDDGIVIKGYQGSNPTLTAKVLCEKIKTLEYDIVILGNQSANSYTGLLPGKVATLLGVPLLGNAVSIDLKDKEVNVKKVLEDHDAVLGSKLPAVISVAQEINEPRLPPVLQIMAAGRKPIKAEASSVTVETSIKAISNKAPKSDRKREVFEDIDKAIPEFVKAIKEGMR